MRPCTPSQVRGALSCRFRLRPLRHERPSAHNGQSAIECCIALVVLTALACPCIEAARMATDSLAVKTAAVDVARAAAASGSSTFDEQALLQSAYPQLSDGTVRVASSPPTLEPYRHHLVKEDGTVLARDSLASCQRFDAEVTVSRAFITPMGAVLSALAGKEGYTVSGRGMALRDVTAESGRW